MSIAFRWSVWGDKRSLLNTLPYSVGTFRRAFGDSAQYLVFTDEPDEIKSLLTGADVRAYRESGKSPFDLDSRATWRKWCPTPRCVPQSTEFYVDADVFLIGDPRELREFSAAESRYSFLAFPEAVGSPHQVGRFAPRILRGMPPINTGFLGQRVGADITKELLRELRWWLECVPVEQRHFFDDQGAVVAILARHYLVGAVQILPHDRYRIVSPTSNRDINSLDGIAAFHATQPTHRAFHRFRNEIEAFIMGAGLK